MFTQRKVASFLSLSSSSQQPGHSRPDGDLNVGMDDGWSWRCSSCIGSGYNPLWETHLHCFTHCILMTGTSENPFVVEFVHAIHWGQISHRTSWGLNMCIVKNIGYFCSSPFPYSTYRTNQPNSYSGFMFFGTSTQCTLAQPYCMPRPSCFNNDIYGHQPKVS